MSNKKTKRITLVIRAILLLLTVSVLISLFFPQLFPFTQEQAANWIERKPVDRLLFVALQIFQVIVPPISHYFTSVLGGYLYGAVEGGILNYIGRLIGQIMAYFLARRFAHSLLNRHVAPYKRLKSLVSGEGKNLRIRALIIFTMIALPFFPDDELSYLMGLTRFPIGLFFIVTAVGHILGSFALAFLGSGEPFTGILFFTLATTTLLCFLGLLIGSFKWRSSKE
jgi:uncharacterized membrane protein YdjX (TVP38/TMEM64 family)